LLAYRPGEVDSEDDQTATKEEDEDLFGPASIPKAREDVPKLRGETDKKKALRGRGSAN